MSEEKRWIILGDDGRHVTVGRHSDPTEDEIQNAGKALEAAGMGGWLAVTEGAYYGRTQKLGLLMVREIAPPKAAWDEAASTFHTRRLEALRPTGRDDDRSPSSGPS